MFAKTIETGRFGIIKVPSFKISNHDSVEVKRITGKRKDDCFEPKKAFSRSDTCSKRKMKKISTIIFVYLTLFDLFGESLIDVWKLGSHFGCQTVRLALQLLAGL